MATATATGRIAQVIGAPEPGQIRPADRPQPPPAEHALEFGKVQPHKSQTIGKGVRPRRVAPVPKPSDIQRAVHDLRGSGAGQPGH